MLGFICIFFPAIISVYLYGYLKKAKIDLFFFWGNYSIYLISINFIIILVITFIFNNKYSILNEYSFTNLFTIKYFSLALFLSCLLPVVFNKIRENYRNIVTLFFDNIQKIKNKINNKEFLNYIFNIGLIILVFIFLNMLISSLLFIFKVRITSYNVIISSLLTIIFSIYLMKVEKYSFKKMIVIISIVFSIIVLTIVRSSNIYDLSWDGNAYHKVAVGQLKEGWNPVYENIEAFNNSKNNSFKLKKTYEIWNNHYAKGYWIYAANIYKFTNNIESGKSILLLMGISCFLICFSYLGFYINKAISFIISFIIILNPVYFTQIHSYYNDGLIYIFISLLVITLSKMCYERDNISDNKNYLLYALALIILINIKFTGFAYAGIYSLIYYLYFLINPRLRKRNLKKMTLIAIVSLFIGVSIIGLSTYPKNYKTARHIFYPLFGKEKVDIMTMNAPKNFQDMNNFQKVFLSNFSKTANLSYVHEKEPELKIPFTVHQSELVQLEPLDIRIGGFGVLFSGILIISLIIILIGLVNIYRENKELFFVLIIPIITTILLLFILDDAWWARYLPQLYWLPIISIIILIYFNKSFKLKLLNLVLIILMFLNSFYFFRYNIIKYYQDSNYIKKNLNSLQLLNEEEKLYFYTIYFEGMLYNIKDKINNFKIIKNNDDLNNYNKMEDYNLRDYIYIYKLKR